MPYFGLEEKNYIKWAIYIYPEIIHAYYINILGQQLFFSNSVLNYRKKQEFMLACNSLVDILLCLQIILTTSLNLMAL